MERIRIPAQNSRRDSGEHRMSAIRRILVAVKDLQARSMPAVLKAAQLARAYGAKLELFHALSEPVYADAFTLYSQGLPALEQQARQQALRRLETVADRLRTHSISVSSAAEWDFPAYEAIVRQALRVRADLIVVGPHPGTHKAPWLLRLTDWELVRVSPLPLLLVRNPRAYRHPAVLAAIDPTHAYAKPLQLDREILKLGEATASGLHGTLHAVHAYSVLPVAGIAPATLTPGAWREVERQAERSASEGFERALRPVRVPRTRRYLFASNPIDAITEAARRSRSAIVVMGAVSRSGIKRLVIGNTAERILDVLSCDVLVVKPDGFPVRIARTARGPRVAMPVPPAGIGYF
jgi:universal stress protein E